MEQIYKAVSLLKDMGFDKPELGIVLGTGLGNLVHEIEIEKQVAYEDIPGFPIATVEFHKGNLIYGSLEGKKVLVMQGRFHYYEGYSMQEITFPIRVMKLLGVQKLLLSNACGAMSLDRFKKGDIALVDDHINLLPDNPLRGTNMDEFGDRFVDMSAPYDTGMNSALKSAAAELDLPLNEAVYASVMGPNLETRAEYRYLKIIGADIVGMSTVPEVIVANHMSLPCAVLSVITDECDPDNLHAINIEDIIAVAKIAEEKMIRLIKQVITKI